MLHASRQAPESAVLIAPLLPLPDRLAKAMIDQLADGGCTRRSLLDAGFTAEDLTDDNLTAARIIANGRFVKIVEACQPTREDYVATGAAAVEGIMPTRKVILATMTAAGIPERVADDIFEDVCVAAGRHFAHPVGTH